MQRICFPAFIVFLFLASSEVHACQPCTLKLDFDDTVKAADLVVIGRKIGEYPSPEMVLPNQFGPDWIRIEVVEILKGFCESEVIKVNSYNGMCPYGIVIKDENSYVLFLKKAIVDYVDYDAVNHGCAEKILPVTGKEVEYQGKPMSLKIFRMMIESVVKETQPREAVPPLPANISVR